MIQGALLAKAIISGANNITNNKQEVDELNVFPVPDGDTGTNMSMTINACKKELEMLSNPNIEKTADTAASALLRGARGNSGVILSLLFRGFSKGLKGKSEINGVDFANALTLGVAAAYKAVMKPTEGTMLTVARVAAEEAMKLCETENDPMIVFDLICKQAKITLDQTPEMLPVLKKACVVDAGGMGLLLILEGMQYCFKNDKVVPLLKKETKSNPTSAFNTAVSEYDGEITFTYCTEFIVNKNPFAPDPLKLRAKLETMGDCVVVVDDDDIIKVHVHTDNPGNALQEGLKYGQLSNMKIENMREQHQAKVSQANNAMQFSEYCNVDEDIPFGFVAVAAGQGLAELFCDLGVNKVVSGGQTMNPSTDDILTAIQAVPAKTVFVLPNNKNIILAAEQAAPMADRQVCVLQTRTIPQGIAAMLAFDSDRNYDDNRLAMTKQFDLVQTGLITFAARNSDFDGHNIKKGEILALDNGKLTFIEKDITKALLRLIKTLSKRAKGGFITIIYGADVTDEQAEIAFNTCRERFGNDYEISLINGGQPVYYYMISVE